MCPLGSPSRQRKWKTKTDASMETENKLNQTVLEAKRQNYKQKHQMDPPFTN